MSATLLADTNGAKCYHADWRALLSVVLECDTLIVDAPYSERTHAGHDGAVTDNGLRDVGACKGYEKFDRRALSYSAWTAADVSAFVGAWSPVVSGWMVSITDDVLAHDWQRAMAAAGRYAFAPLPFVAPGSRVRLTGDGPSNWSTWIVVGRPRTKAMAKWGTLPGAYVLPPGCSERMPVVGGKPTWLLRELIKDYSREGDLVVDPCCGGGSSLVAALREGRRAIGGDVNADHAGMAAAWIQEPWAKSHDKAAHQPSLFAATGQAT